MKGAQPLEKLAAEPLERQVDDLAAELASQPPPARRRHPGADDRDVLVFAVQERRGQQPLFQGIGEIEPLVGPDVGDRPRRKDEEGAAVLGLGDPRTDQVLHGIGGVEGQGRFLGVLGVPGRAVDIHLGVGRDVEQEDHDLERPAAGGHDLDVQTARMPVPQRLADVDAVANAGREFLGARQIGAQDGLGLFANVAMETLDPVVLGRPRAHAERVPALAPPALVFLLRAGPQLAGPPRQHLSRQAADHRPGAPDGQLGLIDPHPGQPRLFEAG